MPVVDHPHLACELCPLYGPAAPCPLCYWGPEEAAMAALELRHALNACHAELVRRQDPEYLEQARLAMIFDLAPDLETAKALALGERVPISKLNQERLKRWGRRA
jgi:hypothetical protein